MRFAPGRLGRALPYVIVGAAAGYLFFVATQFEFHRRAGTLGPDFWPKLVLGLIVATCLYEVVKIALVGGEREATGVLQDLVAASESGPAGEPQAGFGARYPLLLVSGIALTAVYVWLIQKLGFVLATAPYIAVFIALGGYRRWAVNAAVSVIGTLLMMFFFMKVVYVSLPLGHEPFAQLMLFLMRVMGIR